MKSNNEAKHIVFIIMYVLHILLEKCLLEETMTSWTQASILKIPGIRLHLLNTFYKSEFTNLVLRNKLCVFTTITLKKFFQMLDWNLPLFRFHPSFLSSTDSVCFFLPSALSWNIDSPGSWACWHSDWNYAIGSCEIQSVISEKVYYTPKQLLEFSNIQIEIWEHV